MATSITVGKGKVTATYKDSLQGTVTEPLAYTKWNFADSAENISAYMDASGSEVSTSKVYIATAMANLAKGLENLSQNTYDGVKISYDVKIITSE